jgi:quercetin dioxygenase-like cupin family protein
MRVIRKLLDSEGWYLAEAGLPLQVGIKFGSSPFGKKHLHRTMGEYFLLLAGDLSLIVNGQTVELAPGDLVVVEAGEAHEVVHASPDARLLLLMPPPVDDDKVELPDDPCGRPEPPLTS